MTKPELSNKHLKTLASRQHYTLIAIALISLFTVLSYIVAKSGGDDSIVSILKTCIFYSVVLAAINSFLLVFSAYGFFSGFFVALCFALAIYYLPWISIFFLVGINQQATAILKSYDIKVGFLGADKKQFAGKT